MDDTNTILLHERRGAGWAGGRRRGTLPVAPETLSGRA
jgi:hypothetical protein